MGFPPHSTLSANSRMQALQQKMQQSSHQKRPIAGIADEEKKKKKQVKQKIDFYSLRNKIGRGVHLEQKVRKEKEAQLKMLLEHALFLNSDEPRRKRWISSIPLLKDELLQNLLGAVIRENLRFKKGTRDLVIELNKKNVNGQK